MTDEERGYESDRTPEGRLGGMARDIELGLTPVLAWPTQFENPKSMTAVEAAKDIRAVVGELKGLREAAKLACDLLAERVHGSPARSPGHNARLKLETALSAHDQPADSEGSREAKESEAHRPQPNGGSAGRVAELEGALQRIVEVAPADHELIPYNVENRARHCRAIALAVLNNEGAAG